MNTSTKTSRAGAGVTGSATKVRQSRTVDEEMPDPDNLRIDVSRWTASTRILTRRT